MTLVTIKMTLDGWAVEVSGDVRLMEATPAEQTSHPGAMAAHIYNIEITGEIDEGEEPPDDPTEEETAQMAVDLLQAYYRTAAGMGRGHDHVTLEPHHFVDRPNMV